MNTHQLVSTVILFLLGGSAAFVIAWYLLGVGIGIAHRGYNRIAPYRIRRVIEVGRNDLPTRTYTWESRV
jgi:hypothetical protein